MSNVKCQMHLAFAMVPSYFWNHIWIDMLNFFIIFYKTSLSLSLSLCATPQSSHCCPPCHTVKVVAPSTMPHHQPLTCSELPPMDLSHMDGYAKSFWYLGTFGSISMNLPKFFCFCFVCVCGFGLILMDYDGLILVDYGGCGLIMVVVLRRKGVVRLILGLCYGGQQWLDEFGVWLRWSMVVGRFWAVVGCGGSWCSDLVGVGCGWFCIYLFLL